MFFIFEKLGHNTASTRLKSVSEMMNRDVSEDLLESIMEAVGESLSDCEAERALSSEASCAALESLLKNVTQDPDFFGTITRALFIFCKRGLHRETEVLLRYEADLDYKDDDGCTSLHVAVERGDAKMVEILMTQADSASTVATCPYFDECPLVKACMDGELECARIMLEHGADANAEDTEGKTPLMLLVEEQKGLDVLELLLEKGADPNFLSTFGRRMESVLYDFIFDALLENGETQLERCEYAVKVTRLLLRHGFTVQCCGGENDEDSLVELCLGNFTELFQLAALLFEQEQPFDPPHECWSRFEVLRKNVHSQAQSLSEAEARPVVDKANALLDLPIVFPPLQRFTVVRSRSQEGVGAESGQQGADWTISTAPASLQSLCRVLIRCLLLPLPLEPKIQALPTIPPLIKDLLMPVKQG